jgi:copper(I)-binding protein
MKYIFMAAMLCLVVAQANAREVTVSNAWARASAPGQDSAAVSLHIVSQKDASIVSVSSDASASAEIHSMVMDGDIMRMRALDALPLAAEKEIALGDDGNHLMLIGLKKPLAAGDIVPVTIIVQFGDKHKEAVRVKALVKPLTESREHMHHH